MVKSLWACMATASPAFGTPPLPVSVPGGNPVTEAAGHIPTLPVTVLLPVLLTEGVAPRIPKLQDVCNPEGGGSRHGADVVNVHEKLAASALPNSSIAPVVIVAVKGVLAVRLAAGGVKVATLVDELYATVPDTLVPLAVFKVNVEVLIVAGFIALLNVAVIIATLGQTTVEPFGGVTEVTVGPDVGLPGPPVLESGSLHPAVTTANRNARIQILLIFDLRISFSSSPKYKAFSTACSRPRDVRNFKLH